jgi:Peptidase A4 family
VTVNVLQVLPADQTEADPHWAGYADWDGTTFYTAVRGSWIVPVVNCGNAVATVSSTWVGIDGQGSGTVEQTGTEQDCNIFSGVYSAWYEMWPLGPVTINSPVSPGDHMSASVTANGDWSFALTITDNTAGWTFSTTQTNTNAQQASAECIEERTDDLGFPLADFGSVTFTGCEATAGNGNGAGVATPIWDHRYQPCKATNGGTVLAVASPLSDDGTQFTVNWLNGN